MEMLLGPLIHIVFVCQSTEEAGVSELEGSFMLHLVCRLVEAETKGYEFAYMFYLTHAYIT